MKLKVEYLKTDKLKTYGGNAKLHPAEQVEQIKKSIEEFGLNDPIAIDEDNTIIEGHGRLLAANELGMKEVPIIRLTGLTEEQRRAYTLVHNKLTLNSGFDIDILISELDTIVDIDMEQFGFELFDNMEIEAEEREENYVKSVDIPQYTPLFIDVGFSDMVNMDKTKELIDEIDESDADEETKDTSRNKLGQLYTETLIRQI